MCRRTSCILVHQCWNSSLLSFPQDLGKNLSFTAKRALLTMLLLHPDLSAVQVNIFFWIDIFCFIFFFPGKTAKQSKIPTGNPSGADFKDLKAATGLEIAHQQCELRCNELTKHVYLGCHPPDMGLHQLAAA